MAKQTKSFIVEIKGSRTKRTKPAEQSRSIWGKFTEDLKRNLAEAQETPVSPPIKQDEREIAEAVPAAIPEHVEDMTASNRPDFVQKWSSKRAEKPKANTTDAVSAFVARIEQQKSLLSEFLVDPQAFTNWRAAWFRRVAGGFGVKISYDAIDAGGGLHYVVVDTAEEVADFFSDLAQHAQTDPAFQTALQQNRRRRAARRIGGK